jgi:uncharacterized membrane protein YedE/YeeE
MFTIELSKRYSLCNSSGVMFESLFPIGVEHYLLGGLLVGLGISIPFALTGLVAGASTVFTSTWSFFVQKSFFQSEGFVRTRAWRLTLSAGLITGGLLYVLFVNSGDIVVTELHPLRLFLGGVLIGIGTRMSGGCASGHGICGNASLEKVSLVATITFLATAIIVAQLTSMIF